MTFSYISTIIKLLFIRSLGSRPVQRISETYHKMEDFNLCSGPWNKINSEEECKKAANELNLSYANSWDGPDDFPGCMFAHDGRDKVYFNTSPHPQKVPANKKYAAICKPMEKGAYEQDKSADEPDEIVSIKYPPSDLKKAYIRELKEQKISPRSSDGQECQILCMGPFKNLLHHTNKAVAGYDGDKEGHVGIYGVPTFPPTEEPTEKPIPTEKPKANDHIFKDKIFEDLPI